MAMVVTEPCYGCKYTECVTDCPCDCFREGASMLYIDPVACIECWACVSACPTQAIFQEDEVPDHWAGYVALNREMALQCPEITQKKPPLADS